MELFDVPDKRRRAAGYLPLYDDALLADEPVDQSAVTPEERDSILKQVGALTGGTLSRVGDALSAPGDYVRGALAGKLGERVTGRDLLREYGLVGEEDNWGNFVAGTVADVATDPLSYLAGPAKAYTEAGKVAGKLNLLDNAATVASKKALSSGVADDALPMVARQNKKALEATGRTLSTMDPAMVGRPLYGTRTAQRSTTLDDLLKNADDPAAAEKAARELLGDRLDEVRGQTLSKTFGVGLPFQDPAIVGDLFGKGFGDNYADVLDTIGQGIRWSKGGRLANSLFNNKVGGAIDAEEQITNLANFDARSKARAVATNADTYNRAKLYAAHPEVFSEEGNRIMGRVIEGHGTPDDLAYVAARPEMENYINGWKNIRIDALENSRQIGLTDASLKDDYGAEYLPRRAEAALEKESKVNRKLGSALSTLTGDTLRRTEAMQLPGGRDTIINLSRDINVSGPTRTIGPSGSDDEAAKYLLAKLQPLVQPGQPDLDIKKMTHLARVLHELPKDVVQKSPLFGQHPVESIGSYLTGRAESAATMGTIYDSLAAFTTDGAYNTIAGGRHISLADALNRVGARTYDDGAVGAAQQMRQRIAQLRGVAPDDIKLSEISIPEEHVNRLLRARDAYETGEASGAMMKWLDHYTQAWRGSILTWPSRAVRDLYSGAVSNWLEGALEPEAIFAAKGLLNEGGNSPAFRSWLSKQSRYAGDDGIAQFYADLAATELVGGPSGFELGASTTGQRALDPIIGAEPVTVGSIVSELMPKNRTWGQFGKDFMTWRSQLKPTAETMNPILRAGEKMNSLSDGINRISGFMSLLSQGYDPQAAAKAMKRAHVDYGSLSGFEKNVLKKIFPWYSYQSRIFREVLRQLVERPGGRYGQMIQGLESVQDSNDDVYISSGLRSQVALPLPEMLGGKPAPGTQRFVTSFEVPGAQQIGMIETPGTLGGTIKGTARQLAMQSAPFLRLPLETAFGIDLFTNRPAGEATSPLDAIGRAVTGDQSFDVPTVIDKGVELLPFSARPLYLARSLLDTRGGASLASRLAKGFVNASTGVKVRDQTEDEAAADAVSEIEGSIDPYTREFKQVYIPKHLEPDVPQWALRRLAVARELGRERREARKDRNAPKKKKKKSKGDVGPPNLFE